MSKHNFGRSVGLIADRLGVDVDRLRNADYVHNLGVKAKQAKDEEKYVKAGVKHLEAIAEAEANMAKLREQGIKASLSSIEEINKSISGTTIAEAKYTSNEQLLRQKTANSIGLIGTEHNQRSAQLSAQYQSDLRILATKHQAAMGDIKGGYHTALQGIERSRQMSADNRAMNAYLNGDSNRNPQAKGLFGGIGSLFRGLFA